jgi:hypothetical protein
LTGAFSSEAIPLVRAIHFLLCLRKKKHFKIGNQNGGIPNMPPPAGWKQKLKLHSQGKEHPSARRATISIVPAAQAFRYIFDAAVMERWKMDLLSLRKSVPSLPDSNARFKS